MNSQRRHRSWIITLPLAGLAAAYLYFIFLPGQKTIGQLDEQLALRRQYVLQSFQAACALPATQRQIEAIGQQIGWSDPPQAAGDVAWLYGQIANLADQTGLETAHFQPLPPRQLKTIRQHSVQLAVVGSFQQVGRFLYALECFASRGGARKPENLISTSDEAKPFSQDAPVSVSKAKTLGKPHSTVDSWRPLSQRRMPGTLWVEELQIEKLAGSGGEVRCELTLVAIIDISGNSDQANQSG